MQCVKARRNIYRGGIKIKINMHAYFLSAKTCFPSRSTQKCFTPTLGVNTKNMLYRFFIHQINAPSSCYYRSKVLLQRRDMGLCVDRISLVVLRGVSHEGRLISRGARDQEQEGNTDTRVIQVQAVSMT